MQRCVVILAGLLALGPPATAQTALDEALIDGLPQALTQALAENPSRFRDRARALISGYGQDGAITAEAIVLSVAIDRAEARASALRRLLALDLDGDLGLSRSEIDAALSMQSAKARGRLDGVVAKADLNTDGAVSLDEIRQAGEVAALRAVSLDAEAERLALIAFDTDGDGAVTLAELDETLTRTATLFATRKAAAVAAAGDDI